MSIRISFTTHLSTQLAQVNGEDSSFLGPYDYEGRKRISFFDKVNTPAVSSGIVALASLPAGARITKGVLHHGAHGGSAAGVIAFVPFDGSTALADLSGSLALVSAGTKAFADTIANGYGYVTPQSGYVCLVVSAALATGAAVIKGEVEYVVD